MVQCCSFTSFTFWQQLWPIISFYFRVFIILNSRLNKRSYWLCPKIGKNGIRLIIGEVLNFMKLMSPSFFSKIEISETPKIDSELGHLCISLMRFIRARAGNIDHYAIHKLTARYRKRLCAAWFIQAVSLTTLNICIFRESWAIFDNPKNPTLIRPVSRISSIKSALRKYVKLTSRKLILVDVY